jgi:hypothetical protein
MPWPYRTQDVSEEKMLTRTHIQNATAEELKRLRMRIEAELEGTRSAIIRAPWRFWRATRRPLAPFGGRCGSVAIFFD